VAATPPDSQRTQAAKEMAAAVSEQHPLMITPTLETLPVYVRGGAIVPVQPLVQSTEEKPQGPLTLRVYVPRAGASGTSDCHGSIYLDDGVSFAFQKGAFLRMDSTCAVVGDQLHIRIGAHQGSFQPWWHDLRVEVYGWHSGVPLATANDQPLQTSSMAGDPLSFTFPDSGTGVDLVVK
jgi:alpha-glucosidase